MEAHYWRQEVPGHLTLSIVAQGIGAKSVAFLRQEQKLSLQRLLVPRPLPHGVIRHPQPGKSP